MLTPTSPLPRLLRLTRWPTFTALVMALVAVALWAAPAVSRTAPVYTGADKLAVSGYDVVAYFTDKRPVPGRPEFTAQHAGVTWRFSSAANRDAFTAAPARYAPQYGGHCAWAVSRGYTASADPKVWRIVDGRLYLNYDASVGRTWEKAIPQNIAKADANWPGLLGR